MEVRIVQEVPLDAPDLVIHLLPLDSGLDFRDHSTKVQRPLARSGRSHARHDGPGATLLNQKLIAALRNLHAAEARQKWGRLPLRRAIFPKPYLGTRRYGSDR